MASNPTTTILVAPSKEMNSQDHCPLFKLAAETRNGIYALVFALEKQDGTLELENVPTSGALTGTCQQVRNESLAMHKSAHRDYPDRTFIIDVLSRRYAELTLPALSDAFFCRAMSFRVNWRADERNKGNPLRITSHFNKVNPQATRCGDMWSVQIELNDEYWRGDEEAAKLARGYDNNGRMAMDHLFSTDSRWYSSHVGIGFGGEVSLDIPAWRLIQLDLATGVEILIGRRI